ncbi:ABC transporter permease subunit [Streptomyces sp. S07_1.15]|uniref:ABC transporter permease subunit n=1 Tax=Streptomyces sp. S07_1.15 TaxID=2873925 RepID=UPI001D154AE8|nr:ABC transporter permease subunit [Streptomyces sp. S07_1.15]MCC3652142.1 ABC transporter permease subunit [Streptomyces sp. S07_1.15]
MSATTSPATTPAGPGTGGPPGDPGQPEKTTTAGRTGVAITRLPRLPAGKAVMLAAVLLVLLSLAAATEFTGTWPAALRAELSEPLNGLSDWIIDNRDTHPLFLYFLLHLSNTATASVDAVYQLLLSLGWLGVTAGGVLLAWRAGGLAHRSGLRTAATALGAFAACGLLGMWEPAVLTLALMTVAVAVAAVIGVLLGLAAGLSDRVHRLLRPVLDTMQVLPAFAYLLPFVLVFGIGTPAALFSTVIYAAPPMARLTALGLRGTDGSVLEASASLGAGPLQRLLTVRIPLARKDMLLGLNQTIMMALSMVVIAALVGAGGLGEEIYQALSTVDVGQALAAGIPIVLIAIWLDRTTAAAGARLDDTGRTAGPRLLRGPAAWAAVLAGTAVLAVAGRFLTTAEWPAAWTYDISPAVNDFKNSVIAQLRDGLPVVGGTEVWAAAFTDWVLNPLHDGLVALPWWLVLLLVAALALTVGTWRTALTAVLAMAAIGVMGVWPESLNTLSQVLAALVVTLLLGFATGVLAARVPWVDRALRPVLDAMQTMPQFVYLIPVVALFAVGRVAAIVAAVVYALPAVVRITAQGLRQVDPAAVEAARSLGASGAQLLRQVQLPLARPALLLAVNQGIVLVLAVVIVGGLVGGGALGYDVVYGLSRGDLGVGLVAGAAIVCLGLVLDRVTQPTTARRKDT